MENKEENLNKIKTKPLTKHTEEGNIIEKKKIGRPKLFKDDIKFKVEQKTTVISFDWEGFMRVYFKTKRTINPSRLLLLLLLFYFLFLFI